MDPRINCDEWLDQGNLLKMVLENIITIPSMKKSLPNLLRNIFKGLPRNSQP